MVKSRDISRGTEQSIQISSKQTSREESPEEMRSSLQGF